MKEIINNEIVEVGYDEYSNSIITIWNKPPTSEGYRLIFSRILEKLLDYEAESYISDISKQGLIGIENRIWLQEEILPRAYAGGLRKVATIAPNDVFSRYYVDSIKNGDFSVNTDLKFQYFQDLISAKAWITGEEVPA